MTRRTRSPAGAELTALVPSHVSQTLPALPTQQRPRAMVVLGMHRSGTSLLSGMLHYLGCDMADTSDAISEKNPAGFWERPEIVAVHDRILAALDCPVGSNRHLLPFPARWWRRKEIQAIKPDLVAIARNGVQSNPGSIWGFKDPRTCRLVPLWEEIFAEIGVDPIYVHAIRAPDEAARSMSLKNPKARPLTDSHSEMMWTIYNHDIVRSVGANPVTIIDYDDWFSRPRELAETLLQTLQTDMADDEVDAIIDEFVNADFRNQKPNDTAGSRPTIARSFYAALRKDANGTGYAAALSQLPYVAMFLRSVAPLVSDLGSAVRPTQDADISKQLDEAKTALVAEKQATEVLKAKLLVARQAGEKVQETLDQLKTEAEENRSKLKRALEDADCERSQRANLQEQVGSIRDELNASRHEHARSLADAQIGREAADRMIGSVEQITRGSEALLAFLDRQRSAERQMEDLRRSLAEAQARGNEQTALAETLRKSDDKRRRRHVALRGVARLRARRLLQSLAAIREQKALHDSTSAELAEAHQRMAHLETENRAAYKLLHQIRSTGARTRPEDFGGIDLRDEAEPWRFDVSPSTVLAVNGYRASIVVSAKGIAGRVTKLDNPALPLILEVKAGDAFVTAVLTSTGDREDDNGVFDLPWSSLPLPGRPQQVTLAVAGESWPIGVFKMPSLHSDPPIDREDGRNQLYQDWIRQFDALDGDDRADALRHLEAHDDWPLVTVVLLPSGSGPAGVDRSIESLKDQIYSRWQVIVCEDTADDDPRVVKVASDAAMEDLKDHVAGSYMCFLQAGDALASDGLLMLADVVRTRPAVRIAYSDEDRFDPLSGRRFDPLLKAEMGLDRLLFRDDLSRGSLLAVELLGDMQGALDWATIHRAILRVLAAAALGDVQSVPYILYHRDSGNPQPLSSEPAQAILAEAGASVEQAVDGQPFAMWPLPSPPPRVSLIVPTRDRVDLLRPCIDGFLRDTSYPELEIVIVDNDTVEPEALSYLKSISRESRVRVLRWEGAFDYSAINNFGASQCTGSVIGLMNNDLKVIGEDWLDRMVRQVSRSDVGAVGARLLYADGSLQHAGVVMGIGVASHRYRALPADHGGQHGELLQAHDVTAVTAACMVLRKDVWDQVGGLSAEFPVAYNDIDLCLKVRSHGYRVIYEPGATLYHLESQSRGLDVDGEKRERLKREQAKLIGKWPAETACDPFYSSNLATKRLDGALAFPPRRQRPWHAAADADGE